MARPAAPPNTPTAPTFLTRLRYDPPRSVIVPSRSPKDGSRPIVIWPTANPIPSGRHVASAARIMSGHGSGPAGFMASNRRPAGFMASNRSPRPLARACPGPWQSSRMDESRYLECLAADHGDLRDAATTQ
jgi:hypothetical protein